MQPHTYLPKSPFRLFQQLTVCFSKNNMRTYIRRSMNLPLFTPSSLNYTYINCVITCILVHAGVFMNYLEAVSCLTISSQFCLVIITMHNT